MQDSAVDWTVILQSVAAVGTLLTALAAWFAVSRANTSTKLARDSILVPIKRRHTEELKERLATLEDSHLVSGEFLKDNSVVPDRPIPSGLLPDPIKSALASGALFEDIENHVPGFNVIWREFAVGVSEYVSQWTAATRQFERALRNYLAITDLVQTGITDFGMTAIWRLSCPPSRTTRLPLVDTAEVNRDGKCELVVRTNPDTAGTIAVVDSEFGPRIAELIRRTPYQFTGDGLSQKTVQLWDQFDSIRDYQSRLRTKLESSKFVVVFTESCPLLGVQL